MKKFALLFFAVTAVYLGKSQTSNDEKLAAMEHVQSNKELLNIPYRDLSEAIITSAYKNKFAGTTMVYLQQAYKGIPVYNQIITLAFKNGKLVSKAGEFIANIEKIANVKNGAPMVSAQDAVLEAIKNKKLKPTGNPTVVSKKENKIEFGTLGISRENITAELMWFPNESGKINVNLGWQVYIIQNTSSDYWLINVDAINKNILSVHNLTVYCNWDDPAKSCDNIEHKNLDHNTNKNLNLTQFSKESSLQINNKLNSPTAVNNATYRVIRYPAESPIHAGGNPALVSNPWNLSGAGNNATTLNWHSIGTTNYDFTRGNNVWAQEDRNANNGTAPVQVLSSTTPDPLTFDFVPDLTVDPTQTTPVPNQQFNTVNLFYWNN
ncbi:MAG: M36 family metallopeptidase, partial [Ferruginibacter sp.]|nr:M36 family metallopeptidase [Ferruginibacter sp.]